MIDLKVNEQGLKKNVEYCREKNIALPTFKMMQNPESIPASIKEQLKNIGLWDIHPANLFRITWKNAPQDKGGLFGGPNHIVLPSALTGVAAPIIMMSGKWFPTGAHKVGATYGCITPGLITGQFDPQKTKAVWPSTGNYCRGGAYISALLACQAIAILPEGMSKERFEWLNSVAGEVIATHGTESNVKEIFDKCWELRNSGQDLQIFNQFDELGNPLWHYNITGHAVEEVVNNYLGAKGKLAGFISSSGSGGTLAAGYYLKTKFAQMKIGAAEALQCPTMLNNGFGEHRIEGIGDKHIPWIHDCKNTDFAIAVDDEMPVRLLRLFNTEVGRAALLKEGVQQELLDSLDLLGISGIGNMLAAIKFAKYNELNANDYIVSIATDSFELYGSRLAELEAERGSYTTDNAQRDIELLQSVKFDYTKELSYYDKKAIHNLKYFTWVEQQGKSVEELNSQWYDHEAYWEQCFNQVGEIDKLIESFNAETGLM